LLGTIYIVLRPIVFTYIIGTPIEIRDEVIAYARIIAVDVMVSYIVLAYSTILQGVGQKPFIRVV